MIGQTSTTQRTESCLQALEDAGITATEANSSAGGRLGPCDSTGYDHTAPDNH